MTNPFELVIDQNFSVIGQDAIYTPSGGDPVEIKVMPRRPDELVGLPGDGIISESALFDVRVSDVAQPGKGDKITLGETTYFIQTWRYLDGDRLVWAMDTYPE